MCFFLCTQKKCWLDPNYCACYADSLHGSRSWPWLTKKNSLPVFLSLFAHAIGQYEFAYCFLQYTSIPLKAVSPCPPDFCFFDLCFDTKKTISIFDEKSKISIRGFHRNFDFDRNFWIEKSKNGLRKKFLLKSKFLWKFRFCATRLLDLEWAHFYDFLAVHISDQHPPSCNPIIFFREDSDSNYEIPFVLFSSPSTLSIRLCRVQIYGFFWQQFPSGAQFWNWTLTWYLTLVESMGVPLLFHNTWPKLYHHIKISTKTSVFFSGRRTQSKKMCRSKKAINLHPA